MAQYQLVTEFGELDLSEDFQAAITKQLEDVTNLTKRKSDYTKTLDLYGSPNNNKFFKMIYDVNLNGEVIGFNPMKKVSAYIRCGMHQIITGNLQLLAVKNNQKRIIYQVSIAGTIRDVITDLGDITFADLDFSEYNHVRNQTNIVDSWHYKIYKNGNPIQLQGPGEGYVYGYSIYGNSELNWVDWYTYDAYPYIYNKTILKKVLSFLGKTYTSKFVDSNYFEMQALNFVGDKIQLSDEEIKRRTVAAGVNPALEYMDLTPVQSRDSDWYYNYYMGYQIGLPRESDTVDDLGVELIFRDDLGQYDGSIYTCAKTGRYDISFDGKLIVKVTHDDGDNVEYKEGEFEYRYWMELVKTNGQVVTLFSSVNQDDPNDIYGTQLFGLSDGEHATPWYDIDNPLVFNCEASNVFIESGDKVRIGFGFRYPKRVKWQGLDDNKHKVTMTLKQTLGGAFTRFKATPASNEDYGDSVIDMNQILDRNKKVSEYLLDIIDAFDLIIIDNPNKVNDLIIEPRVDYFKSRQKIWNWDEEQILDLDSDIIMTPMSEVDSKIYRYTWDDDEDFFNKEYKKEIKRTYGDYEIEIVNDFSDKIKTTKLAFAATPSGQKFTDSRVAPFYADWDDNGIKPVKPKQRLLFYGGALPLYPGAQFKIKNYPGQADSQSTIVNEYGYIGMWSHPYDPRYTLEFGRSEKIYWDATVFPTQNLFEMFHKYNLNNIIDKNAKLLKVTAKLTNKHIAEFDFRDIVFLLGSYWRVMKIQDFIPSEGDCLTDVTLYKIIDLNITEEYQLEIPTSNQGGCPPDMIAKKPNKKGQVVYVSHSGLLVTEDCCKSFGGQFKDGICYGKSFPVIQGVPALSQSILTIKGGNGLSPISQPAGPQILNKRNNTIGSSEVHVIGSGHYIPEKTNTNLVMGTNSSISPAVKNTVVIGDGIYGNESGALYLGGIKITQDGNITNNGINIIDGGLNEVFNFDKTNFIDVIDGGIDAVRNYGGDSKARPIIDGNSFR